MDFLRIFEGIFLVFLVFSVEKKRINQLNVTMQFKIKVLTYTRIYIQNIDNFFRLVIN